MVPILRWSSISLTKMYCWKSWAHLLYVMDDCPGAGRKSSGGVTGIFMFESHVATVIICDRWERVFRRQLLYSIENTRNDILTTSPFFYEESRDSKNIKYLHYYHNFRILRRISSGAVPCCLLMIVGVAPSAAF